MRENGGLDIKLWVDDARQEPDLDWSRARSAVQAQAFLSAYVIDEISLDHDLGPRGTGLDLVKWMIDRKLVPDRVTIHSWNNVGAAAMAMELADAGYDSTIKPFSPLSPAVEDRDHEDDTDPEQKHVLSSERHSAPPKPPPSPGPPPVKQ